MAAALNWSGRVVIGDEVHPVAQVIVSDNVATLKVRRAVAERRGEVVSVTAVAGMRNTRRVNFADGSSWEVTRKSGCGCGR